MVSMASNYMAVQHRAEQHVDGSTFQYSTGQYSTWTAVHARQCMAVQHIAGHAWQYNTRQYCTEQLRAVQHGRSSVWRQSRAIHQRQLFVVDVFVVNALCLDK